MLYICVIVVVVLGICGSRGNRGCRTGDFLFYCFFSGVQWFSGPRQSAVYGFLLFLSLCVCV